MPKPKIEDPNIYIDEPRRYADSDNLWFHIFSEDLEALHRFAAALGLRREWFQEPPEAKWPHYDTMAMRHKAAIRLGAVVVDKRQFTVKAFRIKRMYATSQGDAQ